MRRFRILMLLFPFLAACGPPADDRKETAAEPNPFGPSGIPAGMRSDRERGVPIGPGGNAKPSVLDRHVGEENIVWTDPDNPNAEIPDLDGLLKDSNEGGVWRQSETEARRESKQSGKPLLIWFTDSASAYGAECKNLDSELFLRDDFEEWAEGNVVRLRIDQSVQGNTMRDTDAKRIYVREVKKRYKVAGYPTLVVVAPSGEVVERYKGYRKGRADFLWGQLRQAAQVSSSNHREWIASLEKKGYREWKDGRGRSVFAKLVSYREGELFLVEPDGQRFRTRESNLSEDDRAWIRREKEKRGMR